MILEEVFNEATFPAKTFVEPAEYRHVKSSLRAHGKHITIHGPSGSGKTTLVQRLLTDLNVPDSDVLAINGRTYGAYPSIFDVLSHLTGASPSFGDVTVLLKTVTFIIIDDFHRMLESCRLELAQHLKLWHEEGVRFILIGIAGTAESLLGADSEVTIRNDVFTMTSQSADFTSTLLERGENVLNIRFDSTFREEIIQGSRGVPSIAHIIARNACIEAGIEETHPGPSRFLVSGQLSTLRSAVLRSFDIKFHNKVLGLATGMRQARSVHNMYFRIVEYVARSGKSFIMRDMLYEDIVKKSGASGVERTRMQMSLYNCMNNMRNVIAERGLGDVMVFTDDKNISIEDPSFRFYLDLFDIDSIRKLVKIRREGFPWDVALSFAGSDRTIAEEFKVACERRGIAVFYDFDVQPQLWGKDLSVTLADVYQHQAEFLVAFVSKDYSLRDWTRFEFEIGKDASTARSLEYILPLRLDDTSIIGLSKRTGEIDLRSVSIEDAAEALSRKISDEP